VPSAAACSPDGRQRPDPWQTLSTAVARRPARPKASAAVQALRPGRRCGDPAPPGPRPQAPASASRAASGGGRRLWRERAWLTKL